MGFKNFKFNVLARIVGIILTSFLLYEILGSDIIFLTPLLLFFLLGVQIFSLLKYIDKSNQEFISFFDSIKYDDINNIYSTTSKNSAVNRLNQEFNKVVKKFQIIRKEKEAEYQYLKNIVQHVGIGLITFKKDSGEVQIINTAAKKLLEISKIENIRELKPTSDHLVDIFFRLKTGGRDLVKLEIGGEIIQLAVYAIELTLTGNEYKLVSIQNIQNELEEKEMEAWQNLVRVLTHEIMNSITPIQSLAATVQDELNAQLANNQTIKGIPDEEIEDIHIAVQTIQKRSEGLIRFVQDFRNLTRTPKPKITTNKIRELLDQIVVLMQNEIDKNGITLSVEVIPEDITFNVDKELIEQVLINLVKNAVQSFDEQDKKTIQLKAFKTDKGRPIISVIDNGSGIDEEALQKIFIPFFTTKKKGSGIGLSLSRQIMRQHQGTLSVKSKPDIGTEFSLKF